MAIPDGAEDRLEGGPPIPHPFERWLPSLGPERLCQFTGDRPPEAPAPEAPPLSPPPQGRIAEATELRGFPQRQERGPLQVRPPDQNRPPLPIPHDPGLEQPPLPGSPQRPL